MVGRGPPYKWLSVAPLGRERRRSLAVAVRFGRRAVARYVAGKMPAPRTGGTLRLRSGLAGLTPNGMQIPALALLTQGGFLVGGGGRESAVGLRLSLADFVADFGQVGA